MTANKKPLQGLSPKDPTLKDRIRERLLEIEQARADSVSWKTIVESLVEAGIVIELQLLANYVCQLRKGPRRPGGDTKAAGVRPRPRPTPPPVEVRAGVERNDGGVSGGLTKWPGLQ
jgi:hypothetical protein